MVESEAVVDNPMNPAAAEQMHDVKISGRLKDAILSELAASNPSMPPVSPDFIQFRLQQFFPTFQTPIHPAYSSMIQQAISKLNEKGGSSEEAISRFIEKEHEGLPWGHASFLSHHLKKLCRNGDIICVNDERYMLRMDDGDLRYEEEEEMSHIVNVTNRDGKEDRTVLQVKGRKAEAIDGWSGVNGDQAEESVDQSEVERQSVEVSGKLKASGQRIVGLEEQNEGRQRLIKEIREESQNLRGPIEVVEEVNGAKAKLAGADQEQRGEERKQPEMTEQQIKVLKDYIPQAMGGEQKQYIEEQQQQSKGARGVMKSIVAMIGEQEQPQQGKMSNKQGHPEKTEIDVITKTLVFPCDGEDGKNLKTPLGECPVHPLEEEKMEALQHERQHKRKLDHRERDLVIVCALPAQQQSLSSAQRAAELRVSSSWRFTQSKQKPTKNYTRRRKVRNSRPKVKTSLGISKNLEGLEEKQEQGFQKPEKLLDFEKKPKEANFGGQEATVSLSIGVKDSMNAPLDLEQHGREHKKKLIKVYVRRKVSNPC